MFGVLMVISVKVWFWMQVARNGLLRELKRLELRVAEGLGRGAG